MNKKEIDGLKRGSQILHTRYGPCEVRKVMRDFGVIVRPVTQEGLALLSADCGADIPDLIEASYRCLKSAA